MTDVADTGVSETSNNILEVVDGEGGDGFIPGMDGDDATESQSELSPESDVSRETFAEPASEPEIDPLAEAEKYLVDELTEEQPQEDDDEDFDVPDEDKDKPIGRAAKTIQKLRKRAQAAEQQTQAFERQVRERDQQWYQWAQQQQQQNELMRQQMTFMQQQMMQPAQANQGEQPLDPNDPEYEIKKFKMEQRETFRKDMEEYLQPYKKEIENLNGQLRQRHERERQFKVSRQYNQQADSAAMNLIGDFSPDDQRELGRALGTHIMNHAYGYRTDIPSAAAQFDRFATRYALAKMRARAAASKAKVQASQQTIAPPNRGRGAPNAKGEAIPTMAQAKRAGFRDPLDMMMARDGMK